MASWEVFYRVLEKDSFSFEMHEELSTAQVLEDEVEFALRLERVHQVDDERVLHGLEDVTLGLGVSGVLKSK